MRPIRIERSVWTDHTTTPTVDFLQDHAALTEAPHASCIPEKDFA